MTDRELNEDDGSRAESLTNDGVKEERSNKHQWFGLMMEPLEVDHSHEHDDTPLTSNNERLLGTAFVTFMSFAILQMSFAVLANSSAMKGDSAAMMVDSMAYLFNYAAERRKQTWTSDIADPKLRHFRQRQEFLRLEILPPLLSIGVLLGVTVWVTRESVQVLYDDLVRHQSGSTSPPNVQLMLTFSILNLVLDGVNMACFAQDGRAAINLCGTTDTTEYTTIPLHDDTMDDDDDDESAPHTNLNMCSAYTHVLADTVRSIAVITAAGLTKLVPALSAEVADATAGVVVALLIALSLIPIAQEMRSSWTELKSVQAEEEAYLSVRHDGGSSV